MEDSYHSSMCKAVVSKEIKQASGCSEESGWTTYFEDFSNNNINNNDEDDEDDEQSLCFSFDSPSLVSDAATKGSWSYISNNKHVNVSSIGGGSCSSPNYKSPIRLTFKKTRSREISLDDSLEDTASSPVNSPKISDLRPVGKRTPRKSDYNHVDDNYQEKGGNISEVQAEKTSKIEFDGKSDGIDLKNRELCLVPMSMLVKYLG